MISKIISNNIKRNITNALGWKTKRKIVVIESDDWGSIRMPTRQTHTILSQKGLKVDSHYNRFDSLATAEDLSFLFEVLSSVKDMHGNHPLITANCAMANPDFDRIKADGFTHYHFELFTETLKKYPGCEGSFALWQEGQRNGLFLPQYHGREHLNVPLWMEALQSSHKETLLAFEYGCWGLTSRYPGARFQNFLAACDFRTEQELETVISATIEGYEVFEQIFGYRSKSYIAPNYVWPKEVEDVLYPLGCTYIQGQRNQIYPVIGMPRCKTRFHFTGQSNNFGARYMVRNVLFEPASDPSIDWVNICLKEISDAFSWKTPAIISSHRVNFIGSIVQENRDRNLPLLDNLLRKIVLQWPDVEFMSTVDLGIAMNQKMKIADR